MEIFNTSEAKNKLYELMNYVSEVYTFDISIFGKPNFRIRLCSSTTLSSPLI